MLKKRLFEQNGIIMIAINVYWHDLSFVGTISIDKCRQIIVTSA